MAVRSAVLGTRHSATESTSGAVSGGADPLKIPIDPNGNLTTKTEGTDTWVYEWNANNELTRASRNNIEQARFSYDPFGRRVEKIAGGVTSSYTYDGDDILREVSGSTTLKFVHGRGFDEPLAAGDGNALSYNHADGLGSMVKATNAAGAVMFSRQFDAWGNPEIGASDSGYAFTGREWDPQAGLYYYRARYYDPKIGRFISQDPVGFDGGPNLYAYVWNQPVVLIDPYGLQATSTWQDMCRAACAEQPPPDKPSWACVSRDMKSARDFNVFDFYFHVRGKGPWDYKRRDPRYEDYGNFSYGASCWAAGFPKFVCKRAAGWANQRAQGNWGSGAFGPPPYGDDPADQKMVEWGWDWAATRRACGCAQ